MSDKKNILLISTIYPVPDGKTGTLVCHYFAKEWKSMGYNVRVVNIQSVFPRPFYWFAMPFREIIKARTNSLFYRPSREITHYTIDEIPVTMYALYKLLPHGKFSQRLVDKMVADIIKDNEKNGFVPDFILGHFINPVLEVTSILKETYPNAITTNVIHIAIYQIRTIYGKKFQRISNNIDSWGFRCRALKDEFESNIEKLGNKYYYCYSGIPDTFLMKTCPKSFDENIKKFIYIGSFIERKHPQKVAEALVDVYPEGSFNLTYVGEGAEKTKVEKFAIKSGLRDCFNFTGQIPRVQIQKYLDDADCFVMISEREAYGLVYLEAMARGCITIASKDEGVDGVIVDGENGFLCKAGDAYELACIIRKINAMSPEQRKAISEAGRKTVAGLTDRKVAEMYINDVKRIGGRQDA